MVDCMLVSTSVDTQVKVYVWNLARALQYLKFTRPDITYIIQQIYLHMHDPRKPQLTAMKCTLRYLQETLDFSILLRRSASFELMIYTNADWMSCSDTRWSTSGYIVFLSINLISWSSKR
jgi:hypothetical protein